MISQILEWLARFWTHIRPLTIVPQYEGAIVLRLGRLVRAPGCGVVWTWPLVERALTCSVVPDTFSLPSQSATTEDGQSLTFSVAAAYRIARPDLFLLAAHTDSVVADVVASVALAVVRRDGLKADCRTIVRVSAYSLRRYGVELSDVQFTSLVRAPTLRLIRD